MTLTPKHLVYNALTGEYTYYDNKEDVAPNILKNIINLYYTQSHNAHYKVVYVDENGYEYDNAEGHNGTELPEDLMLMAIKEINENLQNK